MAATLGRRKPCTNARATEADCTAAARPTLQQATENGLRRARALQYRTAWASNSRTVDRLLRETGHADGRSAASDANGSNRAPYSKVFSMPSCFAPAKKEGRPRGRNPRPRNAAHPHRLSKARRGDGDRRGRGAVLRTAVRAPIAATTSPVRATLRGCMHMAALWQAPFLPLADSLSSFGRQTAEVACVE